MPTHEQDDERDRKAREYDELLIEIAVTDVEELLQELRVTLTSAPWAKAEEPSNGRARGADGSSDGTPWRKW